MEDCREARNRMVDEQIAARGISDPHVLRAMRTVPRELFVDEDMRDAAYSDAPLPIGEGQTISQPFVVALMIERSGLKPGERALEIGTGSGYAAALMAEIAGHVVTIERHEALAEKARRLLAHLNYDNIEVIAGDGTLGWEAAAPYDVVMAAASGPSVPAIWKEQLAIGGRLIMPVGAGTGYQTLVKVIREAENSYMEEVLEAVRFVPLIGTFAWDGNKGHPGGGLS